LICVGFGPASLSIAVALHDQGIQARVLFLEKQTQFAWHQGMLIPGSHMQISFLKDMATFRDPRSKFTFLSYLQANNRLVSFSNQSTFYPLREEFNDYLQWCASHFDEDVHYGEQVLEVAPVENKKGPVKAWNVVSQNVASGQKSQFVGRHVVVAIGGQANIPAIFQNKKNVVHSSRYLSEVNKFLPSKDAPVKVGVIGGGQSAVEIFQHVYSTFPNATAHLVLRQPALKPSDDSPL
jgi:L-ornithine N5-oxygenase